MGLNEEQLIVIDAGVDASTNVTAGAGTGKTRVLVERYMRFVKEDAILPSRILALTFTLKAADEMRRRVYEMAAGEDPRLLRRLDEAWIMNFHSFGYRLIRENAPAAGVDPGSDVATATDIDRVERRLRSRFLTGAIKGVDPEFGGDVPSPTKMERRFEVALKIAKKCRDEGLGPAALEEMYRETDQPGYKALVDTVIAVGNAYKKELRRRRLIDFGDMIALPAELLGSKPSLRARYAGRFEHILVDEFQDTSTAQFKLLNALAGGNFEKVTVVGDEKQAIYRWRDARVENIRDFPGGRKPLSLNYRSRQGILDLAHELICKDPLYGPQADEIRLEAFRKNKDHDIVIFHPEEDDDSTRRSDLEAAVLAGWVRHLTEGIFVENMPALVTGEDDAPLLRHEDVAILLRSLKPSSGLPDIEAAFEKNGIPYAVVGGANAAEAKALTHYHALLSLLLPGNRQQEMLHVLENTPFGLDDKSLRELFGDSDGKKAFDTQRVLINARGAVSNSECAAGCEKLLSLVDELKSYWASAGFRAFLLFSLEKSSFYHKTFAGGGTIRSADDITNELFKMADELHKRNDLNLASFLLHLRSALKANSFGPDKDMALPPGKVRIMTIHQAKGLEFPAVAVAGIKKGKGQSDGFFLSKKTGLYSNEEKGWDRSYKKLDEYESHKINAAQEERCLLYVAITRARDYLFVSSPYANGVEGKQTSLFAEILECVGDNKIQHAIIRRAPDLPPRAAIEGDTIAGEQAEDLDSIKAARRAVQELSGSDSGPAPESVPVKNITWPALYAFASCPLYYRYRYYLKLGELFPEEESGQETSDDIPKASLPPGVTATQYGSLVHEIIYELMKRRAEGLETDDSIFDAVYEKYQIMPKKKPGVKAAVNRIVSAFDASEIAQPQRDPRLEEPFQVRLDRAVFQGIFDRVEKAPDGLRVVDYKIGKERERYKFQVNFYKWALAKITSEKNISGYLCYLREDDVIMSLVEDTNIESVAQALEESLQTGVFEATPGESCRECSYNSICPDAVTVNK